MRLKVSYLDGAEVDVHVSASARHLWEQDNGPLFDSMRSFSPGWANFLAHTTLRRAGDTDLELLEWLDTVDAVKWEMPADRLEALAQSLGVVPVDEDEVGPTSASEAPAASQTSSPTPPWQPGNLSAVS